LLETRALEFISLPAFLADFVLKKRKNIVIAGTHGKTTTTALTAYLLRSAGRDPGFLIGGVPIDPPVGNYLGSKSDPFVIEGDEYDSAFFDKRSKFIHYAPHIAVINNLEFDHADIFRDLADVQRTFVHFTRIVPRNGYVVLNGDDLNIHALGALSWTQVVRVGTGEVNDVRIVNFIEGVSGVSFTLLWRGQHWANIAWAQPGIFNARNAAMAATASALAVHPEDPTKLALDALASFRGVKRRQEVLLNTPLLTVIEDFGHHPTALAESLRSFRARYLGARLTAVFEPRSNTARTKAMQAGFEEALALADDVYLGAVNRPEKLKAEERFDPQHVVQNLQVHGLHAQTAASNAELLELLKRETLPVGPRRIVAFFSNGSFDGIVQKYVAAASL